VDSFSNPHTHEVNNSKSCLSQSLLNQQTSIARSRNYRNGGISEVKIE
jgi:hypothetical protein